MSKNGEATTLRNSNLINLTLKNITGSTHKTLVCFDFDQTIVNSHYHNILCNKKLSPLTSDFGLVIDCALPDSMKVNSSYSPNSIRAATDQLLETEETGVKNKEKLKETIETLVNNGYYVAITSFSLYPEVIKQTLHSFLNEEIVNQIHIISGFPISGPEDLNGKWFHISKAMELHSIQDTKDCLLVDDSLYNISNAKEHHVFTVIVPEDYSDQSNYLNEIIQKVEKIELRVLRDSVEVAKEQYERFIKPLNTVYSDSEDDSDYSSESRIETTAPLNQAQKVFDPGYDSDSYDTDSSDSNYGTFDDLILSIQQQSIQQNDSTPPIASPKGASAVVTNGILNKTDIATDTSIYDSNKPFSVTTPINFCTSAECEAIRKPPIENIIGDASITTSKFLEDIKKYVLSDSDSSDSKLIDPPPIVIEEEEDISLSSSDSSWADWDYPC